jgi:putative glutamine amidotransferase
MRPLIAIVGRPMPPGTIKPWQSPVFGAIALYVDAVHRAGADEAVLMPVDISDADAADRMSRFDGLLLTGGADVDPTWYAPHTADTVYGVNRVRDTFEMAMARAAITLGRPVLGICRGLQVLNVALGGTLIQEINGTTAGHGDVGDLTNGFHPVEMAPGCRAALAIGSTSATQCLSLHHQAIDAVAPALKVTGRSPDGMIEVAEGDTGWVVGVQWHPEATAATDAQQQSLFDAFVAACASRAAEPTRTQPTR